MDGRQFLGHHLEVRAGIGLLLACAALLAPVAAQATSPSMDGRLARALDVRGVSPASSAAMAVDLQTGAALFSRNPDLPLEPASNEKLTVTYGALRELGPAYRFKTEVLGQGHRDGSTWAGSLVLKGYGDPTLSSEGLQQLVHVLRARGIRRVTGYVIGDASWFDDAAGVAGWRPSFVGTESPVLSALEVDGGWYQHHQTHDPPLAAAARFEALLRASGIRVRSAQVGIAAPTAVMLGTIHSAALSDVLEDMERYSDNFRAEMVLKEIGAEIAGLGSTAAGAQVVRHGLVSAGIPMGGVRIVDGSGLSRSDRATARELSTLLVTLWHDPVMHGVVWNGLPVAGHSGTLEDRLRTGPAHWNVRAKTGTTNIASALSGYVRHTIAFSVLDNGHPVNWRAAHKAQDRFVQALAKRS